MVVYLLFPDGKDLQLYDCDFLLDLEDIPRGILGMVICGCNFLTSLEKCPQKINELLVQSCINMNSLNGYPKGVASLVTLDCPELNKIPKGLKPIDMVDGATEFRSVK